MQEAVDWIVARAHASEQSQLAFVNPDCLNIAYRNAAYKQVLMNAERVLPDGIGLHIGCRMLGAALVANVNGTDLFPRLCEQLVQEHLSLFLLGGQPGVADAVAEAMNQRYP
ncbi:MAG: glycosyltransferase, partial [Candidatus Competibacteraceae bacterium]|nr:glycosyltransferase [Candidatus Competibacteraceae bacterium]